MLPVNGKRPGTDLRDPTAPKHLKREEGQIDPWIDDNYEKLDIELAHCTDWTYLKSFFGSKILNNWGSQIVYSLFSEAPHLCKGLDIWENNVTLFQKVKARWIERIKKEYESREVLKGVFHTSSNFTANSHETLKQKQPVVLAWDTLPLTPIARYVVPRDVIQLIFSHLGPEDLFNVRRVSKLWHQIASTFLTLPRLFPEAPLINAQVWGEFVDLKKHKLVFEKYQEPNVTAQDYIEIKKIASEVEPNPRIYSIGIIDLPEGLTLNKLIAIGKAPKKGNKIPFTNFLDKEVLQKYGDEPIKKTVRVLVTNGVFQKSRDERCVDQEKLVKGLKCDMPEVIPFMANIVLTFIASDPNNPLRLFVDDPLTYTRCVEFVDDPLTYTRCVEDSHEWKVLVGGFAPSGPRLDSRDGFDYECSGVGGLRKFPGIGN